jgi:hypothetical protein
MIFEIQNEANIIDLELFCLSFVGSERLDSNILRSCSFVELKNCLLRLLQNNMPLSFNVPRAFYFDNQTLIVTIILLKPILVHVDAKHVEISSHIDHIY